MVTYAALVLLAGASVSGASVSAGPASASQAACPVACDAASIEAPGDGAHRRLVGPVEELRNGGKDSLDGGPVSESTDDTRFPTATFRPHRAVVRRLHGGGVAQHAACGPPIA